MRVPNLITGLEQRTLSIRLLLALLLKLGLLLLARKWCSSVTSRHKSQKGNGGEAVVIGPKGAAVTFASTKFLLLTHDFEHILPMSHIGNLAWEASQGVVSSVCLV